MSKILDLAKDFQKKSQNETQSMNKEVLAVIEQHKNDLIEQLKIANKYIAESIQDEQSKLIKKTIKMYQLPTIIAGTILTIMLILSIYLGYLSNERYQDMKKWERSAEIYQEQSNKIKLTQCKIDEKSKPCVAVDKNYIDKTWGDNYKIIERN
ncbi:MbeB family mobilization protein [Gilliamella apicola]|uniref:MbeB family mobilization protein n=2 Tax=Gilliamella apicola TaxID=1196095 RepID=UPI003986C8A3